jgi:hypothetical protein
MKTPIRFLFTLLFAVTFSVQTVHAATFTVADVAELITAITTSNSNGEDDTIELTANGTYTLILVNNGSNGLPVILSDAGHKLLIHGNGATLRRSTAVGTPAFRIFQIDPGADVTISGLTITNGMVGAAGGGILNDRATLTVNNCTLSSNSAGFVGGGGINSMGFGAMVTINNSTISGNSGGTGFGGGIENYNATLMTINNSTLSGNSAPSGGGGGIYSNGFFIAASLTINNSTLSGNSAGDGGGIRNDNATLTIGSTILNAGSSGANIENNSGTVTSNGYNLSSDDASAFLNQTGDQNSVDPMLGALADNGGPTFTHALLGGSPAIDKGKNFTTATTDQRGFARTSDDPSIPNATGGDGTDIGAFELQAACPQGQGYWKNNPDAWPVNSLTLGGMTYSKSVLLKILGTPVGKGTKADASLILADQLIAAKLNIANGTDGTPVTSTIMNADSLLTGHPIGSHVKPSSSTGQAMINDANVLNNFNNGLLTLGCGL